MKAIAKLLCLSAFAVSSSWGFNGWEDMKVVKLEGSSRKVHKIKFQKGEKDKLVFLHTRQSKIEIYDWSPQKEESVASLNEFPLSPEISRTEITLEDLAVNLAHDDLDGDGRQELIVLAEDPLKLLVYKGEGETWEKSQEIKLLEAKMNRALPMLVDSKNKELLLCSKEGIQVIDFQEKTKRVKWLEPREKNLSLRDWQLVDVDNDQDLDLVTFGSEIRLYERVKDGFLASKLISEKRYNSVEFVKKDGKLQCLTLTTGQTNFFDRHSLALSEKSAFGKRLTLPLDFDDVSCFTSFKQGNKKGLALISKSRPVMKTFFLEESGWVTGGTYPVVQNILDFAVLPNSDNSFVFYCKDSEVLYKSEWNGKRFTFPMPYMKEEGKVKVLHLQEENHGTLWWAQLIDKDLKISVSRKGQEIEEIVFKGLSSKVSKVRWLGGKALLYKEKYAAQAKLVELVDGKAKEHNIALFKKADFMSFHLYGKSEKLGRLSNGILEWFNKDFQVIDQVALEDDQKLVQFGLLSETEAVALDEKGENLHFLKKDDSGLFQVEKQEEIQYSSSFLLDKNLGYLFFDGLTVNQASQGSHFELKLLDRTENTIGMAEGMSEAYINRFETLDVDGDGKKEAVLFDYYRHRLTVLKDKKEEMEALLSWQVFDNKKYPYGNRTKNNFDGSPYSIVALDFDGDGSQDLAMICHDRLLVYLAKEAK